MNASAQQKPPVARPKPDLTTVTPAVPPPESEAMDTTTPMDISIRAFTMQDIPKWGAWALGRLALVWPHLTSFNYIGILGQCMADRGTLFLRAPRALIMAVVTREALSARPVCDIVFCFKHIIDDEQQNKDVRLLFRRVEDWARGQGVKQVRVLYPERLDTTYSRTKDALYGDDVKIIVKDLDR